MGLNPCSFAFQITPMADFSQIKSIQISKTGSQHSNAHGKVTITLQVEGANEVRSILPLYFAAAIIISYFVAVIMISYFVAAIMLSYFVAAVMIFSIHTSRVYGYHTTDRKCLNFIRRIDLSAKV